MSGLPIIPISVFVHIPDTCLSEDLEIPHAGGVLRRVSYAEWSRVDPEISEKRQRAYEMTKPCFYVRTVIAPSEARVPNLDQSSDPEAVLARMETAIMRWGALADRVLETGIEAASEVRLALTLISGAPTRSIDETISYVSDGERTLRRVGRLERGAILENRPEVMISEGDAAQIAGILHLVTAAKPATKLGEFAHGVATLGSTALPDFEPIDGLMHTAICLEAILSADITSGVTAAFVERGAALLASDPSDIASVRSTLEAVYAMRSDALHGRLDAHTPAAAGNALLLWHWSRKAVARALIRILYICRGATDAPARLVQLRAELELARTRLTIPTMLAGAPSGPAL